MIETNSIPQPPSPQAKPSIPSKHCVLCDIYGPLERTELLELALLGLAKRAETDQIHPEQIQLLSHVAGDVWHDLYDYLEDPAEPTPAAAGGKEG